jgi:hypothetical protein
MAISLSEAFWYIVRRALRRDRITAEPLLAGRADVGKFTRKIDMALDLGRSTELYQQLTSEEAAILVQLRTTKTSLNEYLHKIKAAKTVASECRAVQ